MRIPTRRFLFGLLLVVWSVLLSVSGASAQESLRQAYNDGGYKACEEGKYVEAERLFRTAIQEAASAQVQDSTLADSLNGLAVLLQYHGNNYYDAEQTYKRALILHEKFSGVDSTHVATTLNNLASLYKSLLKYGEAESLYKRALVITEQRLGVDHLEVAGPLNNLAVLYESQGNYADAESLYKRALAIKEKKLAQDHQSIALTLNNLATLYVWQGMYSDAEPLLKRTLAIRVQKLGPNHPDVVNTLDNIGSMYTRQQKFEEAVVLKRRVIRIQEKNQSAEVTAPAGTMQELAALLEIQGETDDAAKLDAQALEVIRRRPRIGDTTEALRLTKEGNTYFEKGDYLRAEKLYFFAFIRYELALGPDAANVAQLWENLSRAVAKQGREKEAAVYARRAERIRHGQGK